VHEFTSDLFYSNFQLIVLTWSEHIYVERETAQVTLDTCIHEFDINEFDTDYEQTNYVFFCYIVIKLIRVII
jgi:hypothetical protein